MDLDISEPEWVSRLKKQHQKVSHVLSLKSWFFVRKDHRSLCAHGTKVLGIFYSSICRCALDDVLQWTQIVGIGNEIRRNTLWLRTGLHIYIYMYICTHVYIYIYVHIYIYKCICASCMNKSIYVLFILYPSCLTIFWSCSCCPSSSIEQFSLTCGLAIWAWNSLNKGRRCGRLQITAVAFIFW